MQSFCGTDRRHMRHAERSCRVVPMSACLRWSCGWPCKRTSQRFGSCGSGWLVRSHWQCRSVSRRPVAYPILLCAVHVLYCRQSVDCLWCMSVQVAYPILHPLLRHIWAAQPTEPEAYLPCPQEPHTHTHAHAHTHTRARAQPNVSLPNSRAQNHARALQSYGTSTAIDELRSRSLKLNVRYRWAAVSVS